AAAAVRSGSRNAVLVRRPARRSDGNCFGWRGQDTSSVRSVGSMARRKMNLRNYALRVAVLALSLCAGASQSVSAISEPALDDQADSGQANPQVPSNWTGPATSVVQITIPPPPAAPPPPERT